MYKAKFRKWGEQFRKNTTQAIKSSKRPQPADLVKRSRVPSSLPPKQKGAGSTMIVVSAAATGSVPKPFSPRQHKVHEEMLLSMGDSMKSLFDKANIKGRWAWDEFGLTTSAECTDHSDTWKVMADQCHGASSLCQVRCTPKALATLERVRETLSRVMGEHGPWMFVYIWRIVLSVRGISHRLPRFKHAFLGSFLLFVRGLVQQHLGNKHQLAVFLSALNRVPFTQTKDVLEIVYRQAIDKFAQYMGPAHPTVLAMRSHFCRYWKGTTLGTDAYASYDALVRQADEVLGEQDTRTLTLLTEYVYAAFYHRGDLGLTHDLALQLWNRTQPSIPFSTDADGPRPTWSRATYAFVLASKLLAHLDLQRGLHAGWDCRLKDVVLRLQGGDDECRTRAAQVQEMLAHRWRLVGETQTADLQRKLAVEIRKTIPDAPAHEVGWESKWRPDWSARAHTEFLVAEKKRKAAKKRTRKQAKATAAQVAAATQQATSEYSGPPVAFVCPAALVRIS
jgi:hypothetical protein